jgi:predicted ArsR family transcriptional regulator
VAVLVDPVRRSLYDCVRRSRTPVGRDEAASAIGVSRHLAAFHLDKLVEAGLLAASYEAPSDRPRGRGRTPKVYVAVADVSLTVPPRRYELLASLLASALPPSPSPVALSAARSRGVAYGQTLSAMGAFDALGQLGFEPSRGADGRIFLDNCPFHAIAVDRPELVCGLNLAFIEGLLKGVGVATARAELAPRTGHCCVEIVP